MTVEVAATDEVTRQDRIEALGHLNATAKMLRRQGYIGIYGQSYARIHKSIDGLLNELCADG